MNHTVTLRFFLLTLGAFLVMITLFYCDHKSYSGIRIAFERRYDERPARPLKQVSPGGRFSQILDIVNRDTFLLNDENGKKLYWVNSSNKTTIPFAPQNLGKQMITAAWYDTGHLYVLNGNGKSLLRKERFPQDNGSDAISSVTFNTVRAMPMGDNRLLLRMTDTNFHDCRMAIYNVATGTHYTDKWPRRDINCDCLGTDGIFAYDGNGVIFYVNHYNSRILKFDSTLQPVTEYATIDRQKLLPTVTFNAATKTNRFDSPHRIVNAFAAADSNYLYVISYASATNDLGSVMHNNTPVDRYAVKDGSYAGSVHLEGVNIDEVNDLKIKEGMAYLLVKGKTLLTYKFN